MILNKPFFKWLSGYLDSKGNFQVFPKQYKNTKGVITHYYVGVGFHLSVHIRDHALLLQLKALFNDIGKIYLYKNEAHYAITSLKDLTWFINNILGKCRFLSVDQARRAGLLQHCVINGIRRVDTKAQFDALMQSATQFANPLLPFPLIYNLSGGVPSIINDYILGFINGSGSFHAVKTGFATTAILSRFSIEYKDEAIINMIAAQLNLDTNVFKSRDAYVLSMVTSADIARLVNLINTSYPLQGYKAEQYKEWVDTYLGEDWDYKSYLP